MADDSSSFVTEEDVSDTSSHAGSDVGSDADLDGDDDDDAVWSKESESLSDRFYALKDMLAPSTRSTIARSVGSTVGWIKWSGLKVGGAAWIVTTSALLVGLPLGLCIETEAGMIQQEKEYGAGLGAPQVSSPFLHCWLGRIDAR